jgi:pimeloyl-ACP methyl ester carboxylesterase
LEGHIVPLIETTRGELWFADHHRGSGMPLLLVHGAAGTHLDWPVALRKMASLAPDLAAHGKSTAPRRDTIAEHAADMVALLDALEINRTVVAGHSMGGAIALQMALDAPERVHALILLGAAPHYTINENILAINAENQSEIGQAFKKWMWNRATSDDVRELGFRQFMKTDRAVIRADYVACAAFDVRARLGEIKAPALVLAAPSDRMVPFAQSEALAAELPDATLVSVEDAGHMMMLEKPEEVAEHVRAWLERF